MIRKIIIRVFTFCASRKYTALVLALACATLFFGTLLHIEQGIFWVQEYIFTGWPGQSLFVLFVINMLCSLILRFSRVENPWGLVLAQIGLIVLLIGALGDVSSERFLIGIPQGERENRIFYSDNWELVLTSEEIHHHEHGTEHRHETDSSRNSEHLHEEEPAIRESFHLGGLKDINRTFNRGAEIRVVFSNIRLILDEFYGNALPNGGSSGDANERGRSTNIGINEFAPVKWADSAGANFPLLRARLFIGEDIVPLRISVWAGDLQGFEFPLLINGNIEQYSLRLEPVARELAFSIALEEFINDYYPNSNIPRYFQSSVRIDDSVNHAIAMNSPLQYGSYVLYQDSFQFDNEGRPASILSLRSAWSASLPYIGTILLALGLAIHYCSRYLGRKRAQESG